MEHYQALEVERLIALTFARVVFLNDSGFGKPRARLILHEIAVYIHLDGIAIIGGYVAEVEQAVGLLVTAYMDKQCKLTRRFVTDGDKFVGYTAARTPARWVPTDERLGGVDRALKWLQMTPWPPTEVVHTLALLRREAMSAVHAIFTYVNHHRNHCIY